MESASGDGCDGIGGFDSPIGNGGSTPPTPPKPLKQVDTSPKGCYNRAERGAFLRGRPVPGTSLGRVGTLSLTPL